VRIIKDHKLVAGNCFYCGKTIYFLELVKWREYIDDGGMRQLIYACKNCSINLK